MALCPICEKRPAKRTCPALAGLICAICCARDRMIKLECPANCEYLETARKASLEKTMHDRGRFINQQGITLKKLSRLDMQLLVVFEGLIVNVHRGHSKSLIDQDVADSLDKAIQTLETSQSGIIYTHKADSPLAQAVADSILENIEEMQKEGHMHGIPKPAQMIDLLKYLRLSINYHLQKKDDGRDYMRFVSLYYDYPEAKESLIVTP